METKKIHAALANINEKVGAISKARKNQQQNYNFRGIDDAYNELHDLFVKERVIILPKFIESFREERQTKSGTALIYTITRYQFEFVADDGSSVIVELQGEGMDSGDKSINKAFSAALKYALLSMFLIPTEEPKDSENESPEVKPKPKPENKPKEITVMPKDRFDKMIAVIRESTAKDAAEMLTKTRKVFRFTDEQESIIAQWEAALQ